MYDTTSFNHQVARFPFSKAYQLSLKMIFDICRSLEAWLSLDESHCALIHCTNGVGRTGIAIACFMRYASYFEDASDAFDFFCYRRTPGDTSWVTPSQKRYVQYFNNVMLLNGSIPNPYPLALHRVILNGIPNFSEAGGCNPGLEIYQCGKLVYSSIFKTAHPDSESTIYKDEFNIVFRIPEALELALDRDIQIRAFHRVLTKEGVKIITMVNFSFHSGFMPAGVIRVARSDLEFHRKDLLENRFESDFSVDFVFTNTFNANDTKRPRLKPLTYQKVLDSDFGKCFSKLVRYHVNRPDEKHLTSLIEVGCDPLLGKHPRSL